MRATVSWLWMRVRAILGIAEPRKWRVYPQQVKHPITARLGDSSDMTCFWQIFIRGEYSCLRNLEGVSLVVDLGANVGYTSAYFLSCFPKSRVIAVEPDERNVEVCGINLKPCGERAILLHGAAWGKCTTLCLSTDAYKDGREWATQVLEPSDGAPGYVRAWDVASLIEMAGGAEIDLLKIDIERAELAVFGKNAKTWLPKVRNICIELHGPDCKEAFFSALSDFDYELGYSGELTICRNIRLMSALR
jgi:FkbM family methyltransferase